jgi:hypothetical protein
MFSLPSVSCAIRCITGQSGHPARYIAVDQIRLFRNNNQTNDLIVDSFSRPGRQTGFSLCAALAVMTSIIDTPWQY